MSDFIPGEPIGSPVAAKSFSNSSVDFGSRSLVSASDFLGIPGVLCACLAAVDPFLIIFSGGSSTLPVFGFILPEKGFNFTPCSPFIFFPGAFGL